ncbi:2439_t:CDS:2, partial [Dentiscutata heterogama]
MSNTNGECRETTSSEISPNLSIHESTDLGSQVSTEENSSKPNAGIKDKNLERINKRKSLEALAKAHSYIGSHSRCTKPTEDVFNPEDRKIHEVNVNIYDFISILATLHQKMTIYDEANVNWHEKEER